MQRQVFSALSQISKHSLGLAEMVVEAEVFPAAVTCLRDPDEYVRKNVATLMREVVKHTPEVLHTLKLVSINMYSWTNSNVCVCFQLSQLMLNCGVLEAVVDYLGNCCGNLQLPGIMMLGYVAAHSENHAMALILSDVCMCMIVNLSSDSSQQARHPFRSSM